MKKITAPAIVLALSVLLFSCTGATGPAGDPSLGIISMSFQDGLFPYSSYDGTLDAYMSSLNTATGYETTAIMMAGNNSPTEVTRGIIRFDLTAVVPQDIIIQKAYLTLYNVANTGTMQQVTAYKVTRYWDSTVRWDRALTGITWAGGEGYYSAAASSDSVIMSTDTTVLTLSLDTNMVQDWIKYSVTNYGVIIKGDNENTTIYNQVQCNSSEAAAAATRPKLTIYYTLP